MTIVRLFLLFMIPTTHSLKCVKQEEPLEVLLLDYNPKRFEKIMNSLSGSKHASCRVQLSITHEKLFLMIDFSKRSSPRNISNQMLQFDISSPRELLSTEQLGKQLEYACSGRDNCEKYFVLDHVEWFIRADCSTLRTAIGLLLSSFDDKSGTYFDTATRGEYSPKTIELIVHYVRTKLFN